jgi:lipase chaperone LimK
MLTYIRYHDQVGRLQARPDLTARERLEAVWGLQSRLFGDKAKAMFAERNRMMSAMTEAMGDG